MSPFGYSKSYLVSGVNKKSDARSEKIINSADKPRAVPRFYSEESGFGNPSYSESPTANYDLPTAERQ